MCAGISLRVSRLSTSGKSLTSIGKKAKIFCLFDFKTIEYKQKRDATTTNEQLKRIAEIPKREFMRRGINQHTLEKTCARKPVRARTLFSCLRKLNANSKKRNKSLTATEDRQ